ncbi:MAG: hypothetical protein WAQ29_10560 [Nitrososphaeraceae archaeon]|jgi:hypothetical protein
MSSESNRGTTKSPTITEYPRSQKREVKDSKGNVTSDSNTNTNTNTNREG